VGEGLDEEAEVCGAEGVVCEVQDAEVGKGGL
jgi:hypothetical protein